MISDFISNLQVSWVQELWSDIGELDSDPDKEFSSLTYILATLD